MKRKLTFILCSISLLAFAGGNYGTDENECSIDELSSDSSSVTTNNTLLNQMDDESGFSARQVVKLNLSQLAFKNISMQYEYAFHKNFSGALGLSFLIPSSVPSQFVSDPEDSQIRQTIPKYNGWSITPEFRFYPGKKEEHQAPHGFYIAPFFRYSKFNVTTTMTNDSSAVSVDLSMTYGGFTGGLMIGSQWLIGEHFSIDWWILGGGYGTATLSADANVIGTTLSTQDQIDWKDDLDQSLGEAVEGLGSSANVTTSSTSNSVSATVSGIPKYTFRGFGLCLGFYF